MPIRWISARLISADNIGKPIRIIIKNVQDSVFFICVLKSHMFTPMLSVRVVNRFGERYFWRFYECFQCCHIIMRPSPRPLFLIGQTYLSLSYHHCHSLWGLVVFSANPDVQTFSCLFLLSFMLTLPLHEVMTPLFFSFSSGKSSHDLDQSEKVQCLQTPPSLAVYSEKQRQSLQNKKGTPSFPNCSVFGL